MHWKVWAALGDLVVGWALIGSPQSLGGPVVKIEIKLYFMNCCSQGHLEIEQLIKHIFVQRYIWVYKI